MRNLKSTVYLIFLIGTLFVNVKNVQSYSSAQIYNNTAEKYQPKNRPQIGSSPTPQEVVVWASKMSTLLNIHMANDSRMLDANLSDGQIDKQDRERFEQQVKGTWRNQIIEQINSVKQAFEGKITASIEKANSLNSGDAVSPDKYMENSQIFITGLTYIAYASALDNVLNTPQEQKRESQRQSIELAQQNLVATMSGKPIVVKTPTTNKPAAKKQVVKKVEKKSKKKSTSQKLWMNGRVICEITSKGEVWIDSRYVGTISDNYKVWVSKNNDYGSIEKNGEVWHNGNFIGVISDNGDVRSKVKKNGSISKDGKVWYGTQTASIEGTGDWKKAALIYFFDFF